MKLIIETLLVALGGPIVLVNADAPNVTTSFNDSYIVPMPDWSAVPVDDGHHEHRNTTTSTFADFNDTPLIADVDAVADVQSGASEPHNVSNAVRDRLLFHSLIFHQCVAQKEGESLWWPYDLYVNRYPCGRGPMAANSTWAADVVHMMNATELMAHINDATGNETYRCTLVNFYRYVARSPFTHSQSAMPVQRQAGALLQRVADHLPEPARGGRGRA